MRPRSVPEKRCVCARYGLRASRLRVGIAFEAGLGTWERLPGACFSYILAKWPKNEGGIYTPGLLTISSPRIRKINSCQ